MLWSAREWARVKASGNEYVELVYDATTDMEKWGPTGAQMEKIALVFGRGSSKIMEELTFCIAHRDKSWRPCYKALLVLDYLARNLKESHLPKICALVALIREVSTTFHYVNNKGQDHGISVRERAKSLAELLSDPHLLREEREKAMVTKRKLANAPSFGRTVQPSPFGVSPPTYQPRTYSLHQPSGSLGGGRPQRTGVSQEQSDLDFAMRLQRDEERRAGISSYQLEEAFATFAQHRQYEGNRGRSPSPQETDEGYAARLQREEEELARREGRELPKLRSDLKEAKPAQQVAASVPSAKAEELASTQAASPGFQLDDLFSAPPPQPAPASTNVFAPSQQQYHTDPFSVPPAQPPTSYPAQMPASNPWGGAQPSAYKMPAPSSANPWGGVGAQAYPQASAPTASNPWNVMPNPVPQQAPSPAEGAMWGTIGAPPLAQTESSVVSNPWNGAPPKPQEGSNFQKVSAPLDDSTENSYSTENNDLWNCLDRFASQQKRQ